MSPVKIEINKYFRCFRSRKNMSRFNSFHPKNEMLHLVSSSYHIQRLRMLHCVGKWGAKLLPEKSNILKLCLLISCIIQNTINLCINNRFKPL